VATPYFLLKTKENHKARNRIGIVVGTAANKNAVKRNFLKRQARAVFQTVHDAGAGKDFLLVVSSKTSSLKKKQFRTLLLETIWKSKDIKK
jgi:ribonuclease P protein component